MVLSSSFDLAGAQKRRDELKFGDFDTKFEDFVLENGGTVLKEYVGHSERIIIPQGVKVIGGRAFQNKSCLKYVIGFDVEIIELSAFMNCENLEYVDLGPKVKQIGFYAFAGCYKLAILKLPACLQTINNAAFRGVGNVIVEAGGPFVSLENGLALLDKRTNELVHCSCLLDGAVELPNVVSLGTWSLAGCKNLKSLKLPEGLKTIKEGALSGTSLTSLVIPESVVAIEREAFANSQMKFLYLPKSVVTVGSKILNGAPVKRITTPYSQGDISNLTALKFERDWNVIGHNTSAPVTYGVLPGEGQFVIEKGVLTGVKFVDGDVLIVPMGVKEIILGTNSLFKEIKEVVLPEGLTKIGVKCFDSFSFSSLERINFPQSLIYIGDNAFDNSHLTGEIDLPKKLEFLGAGAFNYCLRLTKVTIHAGICTVGESAFYGDKCQVVLDGVKKSLFGSEPKGFRKGWDQQWDRNNLLVWNR